MAVDGSNSEGTQILGNPNQWTESRVEVEESIAVSGSVLTPRKCMYDERMLIDNQFIIQLVIWGWLRRKERRSTLSADPI